MTTAIHIEPIASSLNGLDPSLIEEAGASIATDPQQGQVTFRARTAWQGQLRSCTEVENYDLAGKRIPRRHRIHSDEPLELLGGDGAPNPQDLILAALNACMMVGFVVGATRAGIRIDSLEIDSECSLDLRGAFGIDPAIVPGAEKIHYTVRVRGTGSAEQFEEIHRNVMATSPNRFHLSTPIPLESTLVVER
jgi:uncharacterized OsmC-like protein